MADISDAEFRRAARLQVHDAAIAVLMANVVRLVPTDMQDEFLVAIEKQLKQVIAVPTAWDENTQEGQAIITKAAKATHAAAEALMRDVRKLSGKTA